jgi:maltooligosyltrehalose trehalohydrolase
VRVDGAVLTQDVFLIRYFGEEQGDRLLVVNVGRDVALSPVPEPLLAPPRAQEWRLVWSSESPRYGGSGTPTVYDDGRWTLQAESAVLFSSEPASR